MEFQMKAGSHLPRLVGAQGGLSKAKERKDPPDFPIPTRVPSWDWHLGLDGKKVPKQAAHSERWT